VAKKKKTEDQKKLERYRKTYTKPGMRLKLFKRILARKTHGTKSGQWSARKAQLLAKEYKDAGGGFKN
jgi:hypothetical protein|tara:strand:+ start:2733 stop:2936 length:204 start_codon:yes stop_codon:yes gene_type:complete